jgi:hypothetical protein
MNEGSPHEMIGSILEKIGMEKTGNQILYNGQTGEMMEADIFIGNVYTMRLKHMTEDKWNARGDGRREQRTHQPTGGRGNQGGLKIGEMERDAIVGHGIATFVQESMMKRSDGTHFYICNSCGTIPIYNEKQKLFMCSLCDGPIQFIGDSASTLEPIPPPIRSGTSFSKIEMPYATKLFLQELDFFMNLGVRILTTKDSMQLHGLKTIEGEVAADAEGEPLPVRVYKEVSVPEILEVQQTVSVEDAVAKLEEVSRQAEEMAKRVVLPVVEAPPPTIEEASPNDILETTKSIDEIQVQGAQQQPQQQIQQTQRTQPEVQLGGFYDQHNEHNDAPPLIVVDTSNPAMIAEGLMSEPYRGPGRPTNAEQGRKRSESPRRNRFQNQPQNQNNHSQEGGDEERPPVHYSNPILVQKLE